MTLLASKITSSNVATPVIWNTTLDSSSSTPLENLGAIREDYHPVFGHRRFEYVRFDQSGGSDLNQIVSSRANVTITNISSGTTTTITTSGLTANDLVGGLLRCSDDAGGAGAAPEGESGVIVANTTTVITIDSQDAFSVSPAVNDDFIVILPHSVIDSASGDIAANVRGVTMAAQDQYDYGWVQFSGLHPAVAAIAAGTTITAGKSLIADTNVVTNGSTSAIELRVGFARSALTTDTVLRTLPVDLFCGRAFRIGASA